MLKAILNIFFAFSFLTLSAQSSGYLHWQHLSTSDQLQNPANSFLFKDSKDFLWIGSLSGLQRYDGFKVKNYGNLPVDTLGMLGENVQGQIVEDENNDLWITTYESLNHYDAKTEIFTPYPIIDENENAIPKFHSCGKTENVIWLLHKDSLRQFDVSIREFTATTGMDTNSFNRGTVRKFGSTTLVYAYSRAGNVLKIFEFIDGDLMGTREIHSKGLAIFSIYPISKDVLLIGGKNGLQEVIIGSSKENKEILWQKKSLGPVVGIAAFNENEILITTVTGDVFRYSLKTKELVEKLNFDFFKKSDSDKELLTALVDKKQNIWVSTRSDGIYFANPDKIKFSNLFAGSIVTNLIQRKNGEIWAFTNKNIIILSEEEEIIQTLKSDQPNADNMMLYYVVNNQQDQIWTDYYYRELFVPSDSYEFIETDISKQICNGLLLQDGRTIFVSTVAKGFFTIEEKNDKLDTIQVPGTREINEAFFLYQNPQGDLIVLEGNTRLNIYDPKDFTKKDSVPYRGWIFDMLTIPGDSILWIVGANGLVSFNYNTKSFIYHSKDSRLPNEVFGILPDDEGNIWLSANDGIYRFTPKTDEVIAYDQADGIGSKRFSMGAHIKLKDGRLAFGGDNGLVIFDPKDIKSKIPLAVPQITDILIDGKKRTDLKCENSGATNIEEIEKLCFKPQENKLEFHLVSKEYSHTRDNQVRYRLYPEEAEWKIAENGGKCQYTNIEPGDYTFELQAANSDGIWNTMLTDELEITVFPPFRKTWTFTFLMFGLVSLIVFGIATFIQEQKRKKEQAQFEKNMALETERLRIARDMHDDLGSRLSAISLKTAMLENKFEDPRWKREMEKLTTDAQEISITIRETIWAVDARNDTLGRLVNYLVTHTKELFDGLHIDYHFDIAEDLPDAQMVSGKTRRMVFLAYKEILNNIVKHAQASEVLIKIRMKKDHFILTITDNGIGFDLAEKEKGRGNGLDNMRYRMEKIGGTCRFLPTKSGTSIELNFNF